MIRKNISILIITLAGLSLFNSCTKKYAEYNTDPSVSTNVDVKYLLTFAEEAFHSNSQSEWLYDNFEIALRNSQLMVATFAEPLNYNGRYGIYYQNILPNLFEIRRLNDLKPDKDSYKNFNAITYILQIVHGLKVTDMDGSIPYTEAIKGRTEGFFKPKYDSQKSLYDLWLTELTTAITTLKGSATGQVSPGTSDIYYQGDWEKWIKLANAIKLRIAARYQNQDATKAKAIFSEVMADGILMSSEADQMEYRFLTPDKVHFNATEIDYRTRRFAPEAVVNFMKASNDPRLAIYFEPNSLTGNYQAKLTAAGVTLPAYINPADPKIFIQGGPVNRSDNTKPKNLTGYAFTVGSETWSLISPINRKFFSPKLDNGTGAFTEVIVSYAEVCFYIAEFIQKGYGTGSASDWYNKGITSSIISMNEIAKIALSQTGLTAGNPEITAYLDHPTIKLGGSNDLEKIYIQQWLNFYRSGNEAFVFVRRTGYPKIGSAYLAWQDPGEVLLRRYPLPDPGEVNRENWMAAQNEQGFTPNNNTIPVLSAERLWFDKPSPKFGEGN